MYLCKHGNQSMNNFVWKYNSDNFASMETQKTRYTLLRYHDNLCLHEKENGFLLWTHAYNY